jgi:hypothetical protein
MRFRPGMSLRPSSSRLPLFSPASRSSGTAPIMADARPPDRFLAQRLTAPPPAATTFGQGLSFISGHASPDNTSEPDVAKAGRGRGDREDDHGTGRAVDASPTARPTRRHVCRSAERPRDHLGPSSAQSLGQLRCKVVSRTASEDCRGANYRACSQLCSFPLCRGDVSLGGWPGGSVPGASARQRPPGATGRPFRRTTLLPLAGLVDDSSPLPPEARASW